MKRNFLLSTWLFIFVFVPFLLSAQGILIERGACVTVENGAKIHVNDEGSTSKVIIKSDALGSGSLVDYTTNTTGGVTVDGNFNIELYLTACTTATGSCWHYVSSPVTLATSNVFAGDHLQKWSEPLGKWSGYITSLTEPLNVLQGYAVSRPVGNHDTKIFTGTVNSEASEFALTRTPGKNGFNLVGNPYPSAVNIESSGINWHETNPKVWYYNKAGKNYLSYVKGTGGTGNQYIPAMQGFFVEVNASYSTSALTVSNAARYHDISVPYYKSEPSTRGQDFLLLKAQGQDQSGYDLICVIFRPFASSNYDDLYDALKFYGDAGSPQLYTVTSDNSNLCVNVLPFAGITTTIPLNFKVSGSGAGNYSITATNMESFRYGTTIYLQDLKENTTHDLTANPVYSFDYTDGDDPARFILKFDNPFFGINDPGGNEGMQIYSNGHDVYLKDFTGNPENGELFIYNMIGQEIANKPVSAISLNKFTFNLPSAYYIVRVITKNKTYYGKVYLE